MSQHPPHGLIEALQATLGGAATALLAAVLGRAMWHARQVSAGRRRLLSWALAWELLMAVGMAFVGDGLGEHLALSSGARVALIAVLAYLGPRGTEAILERWFDRQGGGSA